MNKLTPVAIIISILLVSLLTFFIGFFVRSTIAPAQIAPTSTPVQPTPAITPELTGPFTPDDFTPFIDSFSSALSINDTGTLDSMTIEGNFNRHGQTTCTYRTDVRAHNCFWTNKADIFNAIGNGSVALSIPTPLTFTCNDYAGAYQSQAVLGRYNTNDGSSGSATFVFMQPAQGDNWYWVEFEVDKAPC